MNAPHKIDVSKGSLNSTVNRQWADRPDDQRFTSLMDLRNQVAIWADESENQIIIPKDIRAVYEPDDPNKLTIMAAGAEMDATHFAFGQVAAIAKAPANYLRRLPAALAAMNLNYGLRAVEQSNKAAYIRQNGTTTLRGIVSPKYGRIYDRDVADAVMKVAGNGTGDTRWKVPGTIEWGSQFGVTYNPNVDITTQNTTLYASDRDIFLFLVDDMNPIEVGKLSDGSPDLMFRGFYVWNSEVGQRTFGVATMYLRGVCQNRNLWGVEGFNEVTFKHTTGAPDRFLEEAAPALMTYANTASGKLVEGVKAAKKAITAKTDDERVEFLQKFGFSLKGAKQAIETAMAEEGKPPESVWDFAQAITAVARKETHQDKRLMLEQTAGNMLDKVAI